MTLFISPNLGQDTPLDQAPEWELEQDVESNSSSHHADNIANSKLKDSVEGDKEPIWQLTVNQLDTDWCNQRSNEAKFAKCDEEWTGEESLTHGSTTTEHHKENCNVP